MTAGDYLWGVTNLNDGVNVITLEAAPPTVPVELLSLPVGRIEGDAFADTRFKDRQIPVKLAVFGSDAAATETALDNLVAQLYRGAQNLTLGYQDERYWSCRLEDMKTTKINRIRYELDVLFKTFGAFGYAKTASAFSDAAALSTVSGNLREKLMQPAVGGTIYARPVITITFPAAGGSPFGTTELWVSNESLSPSPTIHVAASFAASDVLVIDCAAMTVKLNGVEVDFSGQFITLDPRVGAANDILLQTTSTSLPTLTFALAWRNRFAS